MSGRPGNTNPRRSSEEIVYAILNFLEKNDRSVKLNDIALEIGSNTKLVQRWLKIIKDIQLKSKVTFEDKKGPKIKILHNGNNSPSDNKFGIFGMEPSSTMQSHLQNWLEEAKSKQPSIFSGTWRIVKTFEESLLVIHDPNMLKIDDPHNLLSKPTLIVDNLDGLSVTKREAFFYIMGWLTSPTLDMKKSSSIMSLDILSLLTNNLISGIFTETEVHNLNELFPLLLTDIGIINFQNSVDSEEIITFIQIIANLIDIRVNESEEIITKSQFWSTLDPIEQKMLIETETGRLLLAKINYCQLNPNSNTNWPKSKNEFKEYHVWEIITQIELGNLQVNSSEVIACLFYLDDNSNHINDILYNYIAHIINLEPKLLEIDPLQINIPSFYKLLMKINPILINMNYSSNWNWNDLGKLLAYYNQLDMQQQPLMKLLISRKANQYASSKDLKIIYDYQLIKDYLNLSMNFLPPESIINILTWNLNNGNLSNSVDLIKYTLEKDFSLNLDAISLCHLSLTFSMDFELINKLIRKYANLLSKRLLSRKYAKILKISNFLLEVLGVQYYESEGNSKALFGNTLRLVNTEINLFQIDTLQIIYNYFIQISDSKESKSRAIRSKSRKLLLEIINQNNLETHEVVDYKDLLNKIVELDVEDQHDNLFIYTYMVCIAYLLSIQRESNSYIRDNLRSSRRLIEKHLEHLEITSYGAFAKLMLVVVKNIEDVSEEQQLIKNSFPKLSIECSIDQLLRFLFIRYLIRSRTVVI
ncbi:MAG: hypothetical protein GPJ54_04515 [Candidatus Heimdallarchaeota archaeon]|nr:hypothetical protein [Candidatus Heimdallarchaeota archaeon]